MTYGELKWHQRAFYAFGKFLTVLLTALVYPLNVKGRENLPKNGPFIVIANHISMWEVFFIPRMLFPLRTVFMAKSELFGHGRFFDWVLDSVGGFPVKRGTADIGAIKKSLKVLQAGEVFAIFPEGTRNRKLDGTIQKFNNGVGYIALVSGAPIVPLYFADTAGFKVFRRVNVVVGQPVSLEGLADGGKLNGDMTERATGMAMEALSALM
jgi:1-acyl-sn-glycerol-3-phosphate acyltransferase